MMVIGLTGSVGMGKTTAVAMLRRMGVPVHDADAEVHRLLGPGGAAVGPVLAAFPAARAAAGGIDRAKLGAEAFGDAAALQRLERILHPMVRERQRGFLKRMRACRARVVVLDIPLLFESRGERGLDAVFVVSAPSFLQRARVLARPGMTAARFAAILAKQMPDREKRRRADRVISTGLSRADTRRRLAAALRGLPIAARRQLRLRGSGG